MISLTVGIGIWYTVCSTPPEHGAPVWCSIIFPSSAHLHLLRTGQPAPICIRPALVTDPPCLTCPTIAICIPFSHPTVRSRFDGMPICSIQNPASSSPKTHLHHLRLRQQKVGQRSSPIRLQIQTQAGTHHEQPPDHPSDPNRPARSHPSQHAQAVQQHAQMVTIPSSRRTSKSKLHEATRQRPQIEIRGAADAHHDPPVGSKPKSSAARKATQRAASPLHTLQPWHRIVLQTSPAVTDTSIASTRRPVSKPLQQPSPEESSPAIQRTYLPISRQLPPANTASPAHAAVSS
ncbi:hypothetical protein ACLOJK_019702 [Asimina triloba]